MERFHTIVAGLGAMGSATLCHLAREEVAKGKASPARAAVCVIKSAGDSFASECVCTRQPGETRADYSNAWAHAPEDATNSAGGNERTSRDTLPNISHKLPSAC